MMYSDGDRPGISFQRSTEEAINQDKDRLSSTSSKNSARNRNAESGQEGRLARNSPAFRSVQSILQNGDHGDRGENNRHQKRGGNANRGRNSRRKPANDFKASGPSQQKRKDVQEDRANSHQSPTLSLLKNSLNDLDVGNQTLRRVTADVLRYCTEYCADDEQRWIEVIDCMLDYVDAVGDAFVDLCQQVFVGYITNREFQDACYHCLIERSYVLMTPREWTDKDFQRATNFCNLCSNLLVYKWPKGYGSCAKESNPIIYCVVNLLQVWLQTLQKVAQNSTEVRRELAEISSVCLVQFASFTGRKLWLSWPTLVDEIYEALRSVLINSHSLNPDTKKHLLDLYVKVNEWPKPPQQYRNINKHHVSSQTDRSSPLSQARTNSGTGRSAVAKESNTRTTHTQVDTDNLSDRFRDIVTTNQIPETLPERVSLE